jgi:trafficking protein particle complex subunit 11
MVESPLQTEVSNYVLSSLVHGNVSSSLRHHLLLAEDVSTRLDYLRRNSSLDMKTGLFYLPPPTHRDSLAEFFKTYGPPSILPDTSLRQSQYPFAIEHYRLRFNKAKRRRPRIPAPLPNMLPPLDSRGWSVRTNFKLGAYSEYKQELDVAIKFYELSYHELIELFSSTAILPPRSKRWAEARVLADSISYKVPPTLSPVFQ